MNKIKMTKFQLRKTEFTFTFTFTFVTELFPQCSVLQCVMIHFTRPAKLAFQVVSQTVCTAT